MKWKHYEPNFEFDKDISSSWWGHVWFAYDLVANAKPQCVVELGTHYGVSFFSMCQAVKDLSLKTELHAVDSWEGDAHAKIGYDQEDSVYNSFKKNIDLFYPNLNIKTHKCFFDDALVDFLDKSINLLHIDGYHTYDSVRHDFESWLPKMKEDGIIMFHDIHERKDDFGVYLLWEELKKKYDTMEFYHWHGLGVLFLDKNKKDFFIENNSSELLGIYNNLADKFLFEMRRCEKLKLKEKFNNEIKNKNQELEIKNNEIKNKNQELEIKNNEIKNKNQELEIKNNEIKNKNQELEIKNNEIKNKNQELEIKNSELAQKNKRAIKFSKKIKNLENSRAYHLGDLFSRSIKSPWKILTLPINAIRIIIKIK